LFTKLLSILKNRFQGDKQIKANSEISASQIQNPILSKIKTNPTSTEIETHKSLVGQIISNGSTEENILENLYKFTQEDYINIKKKSPYIFDQYLRDKKGLNKFLDEAAGKQALIIQILSTLKISENNPLKALWLLNKELQRDPNIIDIVKAKTKIIDTVLKNTALDSKFTEIAEKLSPDYSKNQFKPFAGDYGLIKRVSEKDFILKISDTVQLIKINDQIHKPGEEVNLKLGDCYFFNSKTDRKNYVFQLVRSPENMEEFRMLKIAEGSYALAFNKLFPNGTNQAYLEQQNIGSCLKLAAMINHLILDETGQGLEHIFKHLSYERVPQTGQIIFKYSDNEHLSKTLIIDPDDLDASSQNLKLKNYQMERVIEPFQLYNKAEDFIPAQGSLGFQVLEKFMIDAIKQEKLFLEVPKKQSDLIAVKSNPEDLERDQSNRVLKIFFPYLSIREFSPDTFSFEEKVYKTKDSTNISFNLGTKDAKNLKHKSLIGNHAYAAERVSLNPAGEMIFRIYNPHHFNAANRDRLALYLTKKELAENFARAIIFEVKNN